MSLKQRLTRLERQVARNHVCPVCGGRSPWKVIKAREGEEPPPPDPCPGCGRRPSSIIIRLFCKEAEAQPQQADKATKEGR